MQIQWVNHASFIVKSGSVRLLTDPWLFGRAFNESWELLVPSKFTIEDFGEITHIWFSHEHPDHFAPPVLSSIPADTRKDIHVLFQETRDKRVATFCRKLGFTVTELPDRQDLEIAPDFRVTCGKVPFYDSWLSIEGEQKRILNLNDCVISRPGEMRELKRRFDPVEVLLQQFSYASWVANADQQEAWKANAKQIVSTILNHTAAIRPSYVVPCARFVRFCHVENRYMNLHVNRIGDVIRALEEQGIATPVVFFPGDIWTVGEPHDNTAALAQYSEAETAPFAPNGSPTVPLEEIKRLADRYQERMRAKHNYAYVTLASWIGLMPRVTFRVTDLGQDVSYDWKNGLQPCNGREPDIRLHSDSLAYLFRFDWGLDTLFVNGRFHSSKGGIRKLLRTLALGSLSHVGKRFSPELILDWDLLRRAASTLARAR